MAFLAILYVRFDVKLLIGPQRLVQQALQRFAWWTTYCLRNLPNNSDVLL